MISTVGRVALLLGVGLAVLGSAGVAEAAKVKGKVAGFRALLNPVWEEARDPKKRGYWFRNGPQVEPEYRHLYPHIPKELCIVALAEEKQAPQKTAILIRVGGGRTTPVTIVVPPGQQLQFHNTDPFKHRLFGVETWRRSSPATPSRVLVATGRRPLPARSRSATRRHPACTCG